MAKWARALAALIVLAALVVGLPVLLVVVAGWPFPSRPPDWSHIARMIDQGDIPTVAVINTLAVVLWVLWLAIVWSLTWELATVGHTDARRGRRVRVTAPAVPAALSSGIGRLVAAVFAVGITVTPTSGTATAGLPTVAVVVDHADDTTGAGAAAAPAPDHAANDAGRVVGWVAAAGDTPWSIARTALGDAVRVEELVALNPGLHPARRLPAGQHVVLPPDAEVPAERRPTAATAEEAPVAGPASTIVVVEAGDTLWELAAEQLGVNGHRPVAARDIVAYTHQVHAANADTVADPDLIHPGQHLTLPAVAAPAAPADGTPAAADRYTVVDGDTLWDILAAHHGHDAVTAEVVWEVAARNGLEDPNTIYTGQRLVLTPTASTTIMPVGDEPALPVAEPDADTREDTGVAEAASATPSTPTTTPPKPTTNASPPPAVTTTPVVTVPLGAEITSAPITTTAAPDPISVVDDRDQVGLVDFAERTLWWSVPIGGLLAAGIAVHTRRLRGRRMAELDVATTIGPPPPVAAGTELAAVTRAGHDRLPTLQGLLRSLTPHARAVGDPPPVRAVEVSDDRVEVLFTRPAPGPPAGWSSPDGGRSWVHRLDDDPTPVSSRQLLTPALITLGHRPNGGDVLLDVETAGSIALHGDRDTALALARSMILELATYPLGVPMDVALVGLDMDGVEHCDRTWPATTMTRAVRVAQQQRDRAADTGTTTVLAARAALEDDDGFLDPHVFVVDRDSLTGADHELLDELIALCEPQTGVAVIIIGGHDGAREHIELAADSTAVWSGSCLRPPAVSPEAAAQVAATFEHAATARIEPLAPTDVVRGLLDHPDLSGAGSARAPADVPQPASTNGDRLNTNDDGDDLDDDVYIAPTPEVLVRVMGEVTVEGRHLASAADIELLTLLVCMRDRTPNVDTLTTILGANNVRTVQNRISRLRARLGTGRDGAELIPSTRTGRNVKGDYQVSPQVMTDFELLEHRYQAALTLPSHNALEVLNDGIRLMAGPAFRARRGYDWAVPEGVQAHIAAIVNAYAARLMELAFDAGRIAVVVEAARRAGHVIDDPIAELPMRRLERDYADRSGHPDLVTAASEAFCRLRRYTEDIDAVAPDRI